MKKTDNVMVKFLMMCLVVFIFASILNAAEISRDARRHMVRGEAAMETAKAELDAKNTKGFQSAVEDAIKEFKMATKYAPNWGDAWYNLGVAQESAEDFTGAIQSFNKYLNLNPQASDRSATEDRIIKLEYKQERAKRQLQEKQEQQAKLQREQEAKASRSIAGKWLYGPNDTPYRITVYGNSFRAEETDKSVCGVQFEGTISGDRLQGEALMDLTWYENGGKYTRTMKGTISPDGDTIRLSFTRITPRESVGSRIISWNEEYTEFVLVRE